MSGNLCRCGAYDHIFKAVRRAAAMKKGKEAPHERRRKNLYYQADTPVPDTPPPGKAPAPWKKTRIIGKPVPRVDAYERVSGKAIYPSDVSLPRMLYGAILRSPHPKARVKRIDTRDAEKMKGVHAVISASTPGADLSWPYAKEKKAEAFRPSLPVMKARPSPLWPRKPLTRPGMRCGPSRLTTKSCPLSWMSGNRSIRAHRLSIRRATG